MSIPIKEDHRNKKLIGLMYLFSIIHRVYYNKNELTENKKRVAYITWTDGTIKVPMGRGTADYMLKQAMDNERYEVGLEDWNYFSPDIEDREGRPTELEEEMKLQSLTIHHIFIKEEYIAEIFQDFSEDKKIRLLTKKTHKEVL